MNKRVGLLALVLLAVPGCQKRTTEVVTTTKTPSHGERSGESKAKPETKPIFDEDVEGFVLEEPGNAFAAPSEETEEEDINVVEHDVVDDAWIDKRLAQAQEYGFKTIYFNYDDSKVRPDQKSVLEYDMRKVADLTRSGKTVIVEGHACRFAGNATYNMHLSEKRANSVADYFVEHGVSRDKLKTVGRGYEMCIIPEGDMEQQAPNRRVEFYVLEPEKA